MNHSGVKTATAVDASETTYILSGREKTIIQAPWRLRPKPVFFPSSRTSLQTIRLLTEFEAEPSPRRLPRLLAAATRS